MSRLVRVAAVAVAVVAGAAQRGDAVLTSDARDLRRLAAVAGGTVGGSPVAVLHGGGQRYFLSSRTVFPMRTWLPSWRVVGWVRRCDPM